MNRWTSSCRECPMEAGTPKAPVRGSCAKCGFYRKKPVPVPVQFPEPAEPAP